MMITCAYGYHVIPSHTHERAPAHMTLHTLFESIPLCALHIFTTHTLIMSHIHETLIMSPIHETLIMSHVHETLITSHIHESALPICHLTLMNERIL